MKLMSLVGVNKYLLRSSILIGFIFFFMLPVQAQYSASTTTNGPYGYIYPDSLIQRRVNISVGGIITAYTGMIVFMEYIWYRDKASTPFHFYNDNQQWLQMDKFGHSFSAYRESQLAYHAMRWAGFSKKKALMYGGSMGFFLQLPIDIWDGLNEGYGFSWGDVLANTSGAVLFSAQEAIWDEQIVRLKHSYWPSDYRQYNPKLLGDTHLKSFFLDYNGRTQWASASISRITGIKSIPSWLCLSVGYSGGGMTDKEDNLPQYPEITRYRQFFLSIDIDIARMKIKNPYVRSLLTIANMFKFPAPTLEYNQKGEFKFRPLYF
ncbi:MAG: DUF2279 domain-containing protein [Saprospiraceae bacterium]|nr:DUF2279 domain-containing protein [Saprospiraceae bacterium]